MTKMTGPAEVRQGSKLYERTVQCRLKPPSHFRPRSINVPRKQVLIIRDETIGLLNGPGHLPRLFMRIRSPMARISSDEYGVNGPSTAFSNSASSSGLSVS